MKDYLREINGIRYTLLGEEDADEAAHLVARVFTDGSEPITRALSVTPEDFRQFVQAFCPKFTREALSVIARDIATGEAVGVQLNDDMGTELPDIPGGFGSLAPAMALLTELDHRHFGDQALEPNRYAHLFFIAVLSGYRRRGICKGLLDLSLEIARDRGYRRAIAEATGIFSQHVLRKAGFEARVEVPYSTFEYDGTRPFQGIEHHPSLMLMECELGNTR
jgi:ribosomal protein S18 acetylase RimI-like enzyme